MYGFFVLNFCATGYIGIFSKLVEKFNRRPFHMWLLHRPFIVTADPETFQVIKCYLPNEPLSYRRLRV